ncbi:MAG TPA: hypothetical protein DDW50_19810 [Firmicutes bacterium]|jgi:hypothetical protein|nr:hypothetical protein [Bacillota bacterium]
MSINSVILEKLLEQITIARERMQLLWEKKGYTDHEVLAASIEVDHLLNEYDRVLLLMQERKSDLSGDKR